MPCEVFDELRPVEPRLPFSCFDESLFSLVSRPSYLWGIEGPKPAMEMQFTKSASIGGIVSPAFQVRGDGVHYD